MPRPLDGWPALGGVLHRVLARDAADYIADDTRHAAEVLLRRLRRDVLRALAGLDTRAAPGRLGVGRGPLMAARAEGGWLRGSEGGDDHGR
jgi:hypothetical protein